MHWIERFGCGDGHSRLHRPGQRHELRLWDVGRSRHVLVQRPGASPGLGLKSDDIYYRSIAIAARQMGAGFAIGLVRRCAPESCWHLECGDKRIACVSLECRESRSFYQRSSRSAVCHYLSFFLSCSAICFLTSDSSNA